MRTRTASLCLGVVVTALVAWPSAASAGSKDEVLKGIRERYPVVVQLLAAGKIGETHAGLIDAVKAEYGGEKVESRGKTITIAQFVQDENADRAAYFQIIAQESNATAEAVAKNFAQKRLSLLKSGEYWKKEDGAWVRKK